MTVMDLDGKEWLQLLSGLLWAFRDSGGKKKKSARVELCFQVTDHLRIHLFFCLFSCIFILSTPSLSYFPASCWASSSRWLSIAQTEPGVVCLCSVMQCAAAKTRPTETATVSSKDLVCCRLPPPLCCAQYVEHPCTINARICFHLP